jgi:hypothetical protein
MAELRAPLLRGLSTALCVMPSPQGSINNFVWVRVGHRSSVSVVPFGDVCF